MATPIKRENGVPVSGGIRYRKLDSYSSEDEDTLEFDQESSLKQISEMKTVGDHQYEKLGGDIVEKEETGEHYTVEQGVEALGFGWFQIRLYFICGLFTAADAMEMMLLAVLSPVVRCCVHWYVCHGPFLGFRGRPVRKTNDIIFGFHMDWVFWFVDDLQPILCLATCSTRTGGWGMSGTPQSFALLAEYLPSKYRAKFLNVGAVSWASGTMFEIIVAALVLPTLGWRWLLGFSAIPVLLILPLLKFLPESARFLVAAGEKEKALETLEKAAKINKATLPKGELRYTEAQFRGRPSDLFSSQYRRTTFQVWLLWFGAAFSYYGMVLASAEILQVQNAEKDSGEGCKCNLLSWDNYVTMIISTVGEFIALPLNLLLIDFIGRRWTGAINLFGCGVFFVLVQLPVSPSLLTFFIFMVRGFSSGVFNFVYIYTGEVYPTTIRTLGIGTASSWARVGAMATPFVAQVLLDFSLTAAVWVYGSICFICAICSVLLPIETSGRELMQTVNIS
ncbi:hypothetical protein ScPMuIL_005912 [Solemya velum]